MIDQVREWAYQCCLVPPYLDWSDGVPQALSRFLKTQVPSDGQLFFIYLSQRGSDDLANIIDCMLFYDLGRARGASDLLATLLDQSRAGWAVTRDDQFRPRLTRRIPEGVRMSYDSAMNTAALAGKLLAEAFEHAYGTSPNPGHSYMQSVKAVETLACPRFLPSNSRATLGTVIAHLNGKQISLPLKERNAPHGETLVRMMQLLWQGADRHGGQEDYSDVSPDGAKAAHSLAVCLVQLLHERLIETD